MNQAALAATLARNALAYPVGPARNAYLTEACGGDAELRRLVDLWLQPGQIGSGTFDFLAQADAAAADQNPE